jgi:enoyl-CoA hydratase/carnithine racemase
MDASPVLLDHLDEHGVLTPTLNRPQPFNALSHTMLDALQGALDNIDPRTRVIVLAAHGRAFCAGHDLKEIRDHVDKDAGDQQWQRNLFSKCSRFMQTLVIVPQSVIAKVQGLATAAGRQLVANCDLAVAAEHCTFGVSPLNDLGRQICAKSQVAVSTGKSLFYRQLELPLAEAYALAGEAMACNMMAEDVKEGIDAFFEKRSPEWQNR